LSGYSRFSEQRKLYRLQLRADRIFRTFVTYKVQAYYANNKIGLYEGEERIGHRTDKHWGTRVGVGQQLWRLGLLELTGRWEQVRFMAPGAEEPSERRVVSLIGSLHYDTKDRFTFPTAGTVLEASAEIARDILGGDEVFQKFEGSLEQFTTVKRKLTLHPRMAIGLSEDGLPRYDKFYLGGTRTFYGYRTDQLAGDKYFVTNLAVRVGPIFSFYITGRYDFGEVFGRFEEIRFEDLRHAWGGELSLQTPLGPFSIAYGRAEAHLDNLYLNLGYDF
jgi:outer membrane protein assembly factor BamA